MNSWQVQKAFDVQAKLLSLTASDCACKRAHGKKLTVCSRTSKLSFLTKKENKRHELDPSFEQVSFLTRRSDLSDSFSSNDSTQFLIVFDSDSENDETDVKNAVLQKSILNKPKIGKSNVLLNIS